MQFKLEDGHQSKQFRTRGLMAVERFRFGTTDPGSLYITLTRDGEKDVHTVSSACNCVATGGVGEPGASCLLTHTINGPTAKMIVPRNTNSSLSANTCGVSAMFVDGIPMASITF
ncbi:MAG: hypothetical protein DWI29_05350 [Planctomycetota bacterium]|nr:MAG: hypothetical protein DWI29_05350 [Planctomycetota bacterium]